jgi:hypothetical protein
MRVCAYAHAISLATDRAAFQMLLVVRVQEDWKRRMVHRRTHTTHTHTHTHRWCFRRVGPVDKSCYIDVLCDDVHLPHMHGKP